MALHTAPACKANRPAMEARGPGQLVVVPFKHTMTAAFATGELLRLCILPRQHVPIDLVIDWPDMDTGATLNYDIGLYARGTNTAAGTVEDVDAFIDGSTTAQAVGRERVGAALQAALAAVITPSDLDREVVVLANTGGAGTASKAITGYLLCRAAGYDD